MRIKSIILTALLGVVYAISAQAAFNDQGDGTVWDDQTGLMWQQATASTTTSNGFKWGGGPADDGVCVPGGDVDDQVDALCYCENLSLGPLGSEFSDWRLSDRNELQSLVDYTQQPVTIDPVFSNTSASYYWSSTTGARWNGAGYSYNTAVATRFDRGFALAAIAKTSTWSVRCVRGRVFQVSASAGANLTVDPGTGNHWVEYNGNLDVIYTAATGFNIQNVIVNGTDQGPQTSPYTHSFTNVMGNHVISATTALNVYYIEVTVGNNGTVTDIQNTTIINPPSGTVVVDHGLDQTFEVTPAEHFSIDTVMADSAPVALDGNNQYTFSAVDANHTFDVTFAEDPKFSLTVTLAGTGNGRVTSKPAGIDCDAQGGCTNDFYYGTQLVLTATADNDGSAFEGWSGGGCTGTGTCTVTMDQVVNVTATFKGEGEGNIFIFMPAILNGALD